MSRALRSQNFYLQIIVILLGLGVLRLWLAPVDVLPVAAAQGLPDSGSQRERQITEAHRTNELLGRIEAQLREGVLSVRVTEGSAESAGHRRSGKRPPR